MAQTNGTAHAGTASALRCLLDHVRNGCAQAFVGSARRAAKPWLWWDANHDFGVGALEIVRVCRHRMGDNGFINKYLNGRTTDLYYVKFKYEDMTFSIAPPEADGKIHYMLVRNRRPNQERTDLFFRWPLD